MPSIINADNGVVSGSAGLKSSADSTGVLALQTNGTTAVTVDASQNVGVGVTPSAWDSTYKAIQVGARSMFYGIGSEANMANNAFYSTGYKYVANSAAGLYTIDANVHKWYTAASGTAGNAISFTQAMTLDASGNLGVGITSPSTPLHVQGNSSGLSLRVQGRSSDGYADISLYNNANTVNNAFFASSNTATFLGTGTTIPLTFYTNNAERMRIDSSGYVLVNKTSAGTYGALFAQAYTVNTSGQKWVQVFESTVSAASCQGLWLVVSRAAPNGVGNEFIYAIDSSALRFQVRSNGGIGNYSANNVNLSDRREKTNFAPAKSYLDVICAIPVQTFNYIDQNIEEDAGLTLGVIAQDVQAVAPELVTESDWSLEKDGSKMRLSIYQTDLQYALMKCVQEQQALITQLQADVAALKGATP